MGKVRIHMMMSLDGYVTGTNQRLDAPFGDGAEHFLDWVFKQQSFREMFGNEGGETGPTNDVMHQTAEGIGASILGRHMFGGGTGEWPEPAWDGWWGPNPPYHTLVLVLAHLHWVPSWSCHRSILSRIGASNIPGAIQNAIRHFPIIRETLSEGVDRVAGGFPALSVGSGFSNVEVRKVQGDITNNYYIASK